MTEVMPGKAKLNTWVLSVSSPKYLTAVNKVFCDKGEGFCPLNCVRQDPKVGQ